MRAYIEIAKKSFSNNMAFRADFFLGLLNTMIMIFVNVAIWTALYGGKSEVNGITFSMVVTNFVIGLSISNALSVNDFMIAGKVHGGDISTDLLRPLNINMVMMAETVGNNLFRLIARFIPSLLVSLIFFRILPPVSPIGLILMIAAVVLGFLILYYIGYIISVLSFWFVNIWSFATIKNVFVGVLSGTMLPLWFMPDWVGVFIKYTPFDVIYFAPIRIYLGEISANDVLPVYIKQCAWILILMIVGQVLWSKGIKKLVVVGG